MLLLLSNLCFFLIFLDHHRKDNIHKAIFFCSSLFSILLIIKQLEAKVIMNLAMLFPLMLFLYVYLARRKKSEHVQTRSGI